MGSQERKMRRPFISIGLSLALFLLLQASLASATVLPEKFTENTTLTALGSPYTGASTIEPGVTVKVEPGVKFTGLNFVVKGTLNAEGTASKPIVVTESSGNYVPLNFAAGSGASVLNHVEVSKSGSSFYVKPPVKIVKSSPLIENSTFANNQFWTIWAPEGGAPEIANNKFLSFGSSAIYYEAAAGQTGDINIHGNFFEGGVNRAINVETTGSAVTGTTLSHNTITGNEGFTSFNFTGPQIPSDITENTLVGNLSNVIRLSGTVAKSSTWKNGGTRVEIWGGVTVAAGVTLRMEPGLYFTSPAFWIKGTLLAEGTSSEPIVFTEGSGNYTPFTFEPGSGASVLNHVKVSKSGSNYYVKPAIKIVKSSPLIENSTFAETEFWAIWVPEGGAPEIANNFFLAFDRSAIYYEAAAGQTGDINIHGNFFEGGETDPAIYIGASGSAVTGTTLSHNTIVGNKSSISLRFEGPAIPGDITQNTLLGNTSNVITVGGTVAKSSTWKNGGTRVRAWGLTVAEGVTLRIEPGLYFTSPAFWVKGTLLAEGTSAEPIVFTEGTGSAVPINLTAGGGASVLDYVEVRSSGNVTYGKPSIRISNSKSTVTHSTISNSPTYAIEVTEGSPRIEWNRFRNNNNGLTYLGTGKISAKNNDWGCGGAPKPAGCGDTVSSNVEWKPAVQLPELAGHCRGQETQCGEGADPVSLATGALDYSHRDLLLTNKSSVPLEFARSYYSGSAADAGLGPGWSQTGLATASEQASGDVLVVRTDGRQDLFQKTETGYKAPSGVTDALAKVEGTFQLTTLEGTVYRFDSSGRIASITDSHGSKTTYGYNGEGRLATITDPSGQTLTFSYNASNHITAVKDSTGREVKFGYSAAGDLGTVTDALGGITKYAYDSQHRLTQITDPRGNVILKNVYDSQGRITEQRDGLEDLWKLEYKAGETIVTEPRGGQLKYGFDSQNRVVSETDQLGHTTTTAYDGAGNVAEVVRPGGAKWTFGHDAAGNLTSVKDPEGGERKYEYDAKNHLVHSTDARGNSWSYEWSAAGDLTKVTDPEGGETALTYNASGQPLTATDPGKHKSEFSWDARGNQLSATDPLGHKTSFEYNTRNYLVSKALPGLKAETLERDALGDLLARTTPEGHKTKYAYDANGLPTQVTDPAEDVWKIERNAMERPTAYTDPLGHETKLSYNGNLQLTKVVDRRGQATTYAYNLANELTEVVRPEGEVWKYGYDARGNRSSVLDPRGNETTYAYDLLDRMTEAKEPLSVTTKYAYDANGDLTQVTDPRGNATGYAYDKLGRLTEITQPLETKTSFGYDAAGNELTKTTALGTLEYGYDAANRLTSVKGGGSTLRSYGYDAANRLTGATDAAGHKIEIGRTEEGLVSSVNDGRGQSLTRTYDPRGLLVKQVDGRGTIEYGYDKLGRLTSLTDPQAKALAFAYDAEGDLTEVTRPNGVATVNVFNAAGRLAETTSKAGEPPTVLESLKYGYDAAGNVTSRLDQRLESEATYAYDALNRLTEFNPPGEGSTAYAYDAAGNRIQAGATIYSFNALNQPTESSAGTTYTYDAAGRLAEEANGSGETTFAWDPFDHLAKVEGPGGNVTYAFDGLERLSERKEGEAARIFHYGDLGDMPTYATNGEGKTMTSYLQGPRGLVEQRSAEATAFPLADGHGDITAVTNATAEVESRQSFDPWGTQLSGPSLEMGYLGAWERPTDPTTGLIQMGARSYDPALGSFTSEDPVLGHLGIGVSVNRYPYVWDNPLNRRDLTGEDAAEVVLGTMEEIEGGWEQVEHAAGQAASSAGSAAEQGWEWTAPGRGWISDRAQDFWKHYGETLTDIYYFAGENWQRCVEGARAGAPGGAIVGSVVGPEGTGPGALIGGAGGCAGTVTISSLLADA